MTSRAEFLSRIRAEIKQTAGLFPARVAERPSRPRDRAETLCRELAERWRETLERFRQEFERAGGVFHDVAHSHDVPDVVSTIARERHAGRLIAWHPRALGVDWSGPLAARGLVTRLMPAAGLDGAAERKEMRTVIADADLGLTGVDLAIAETGSLVLRSGSGRPRSTSLLPPYHVAVFDHRALVESLEQVGVFLEAWHEGETPTEHGGVINVITGPSRTADIELTLTRGVHGPKEVHAIFVEQGIGD